MQIERTILSHCCIYAYFTSVCPSDLFWSSSILADYTSALAKPLMCVFISYIRHWCSMWSIISFSVSLTAWENSWRFTKKGPQDPHDQAANGRDKVWRASENSPDRSYGYNALRLQALTLLPGFKLSSLPLSREPTVEEPCCGPRWTLQTVDLN